MRSIEPGISNFRVRVFDAPRNDDSNRTGDIRLPCRKPLPLRCCVPGSDRDILP